jgi:sugar/nucleoside kinase (ribokinase family)
VRILLIGRTSIDIYKDFNAHKVGGNIFNVAKTLLNLNPNLDLTYITPVAKDELSKEIELALKNLKLNVIRLEISKTPFETYEKQAVTLNLHDMEKEIKNINLNINFKELINYDMIIADLHAPELINQVIENNPNSLLIIDGLGPEYVNRIKQINRNNLILKLNREQARSFALSPIYDTKDYIDLVTLLKNQKINRAIITLDKDGCIFLDHDHLGIIKAGVITNKKYYDAGDSFLAGVAYALTISKDIELAANQGIEQSARQIKHEIDAKFLQSLEVDK